MQHLIDWTFQIFDNLLKAQEQRISECLLLWKTFIHSSRPKYLALTFFHLPPGFQLAFSGGKDSHALLGVYIAWMRDRGKSLDVEIVFSDTYLESHHLYKLVNAAREYCESIGIPFKTVYPETDKTFWVQLFGFGYPVPDYKNRWCTKNLKIKPMAGSKRIVLAGSHKGESSKRDKRLSGCGSTECGIDKVVNKIEPIAIWRNCTVWDWLIECDGTYLYKGVLENLNRIYAINEGESGGLRMGCFMCPVVGFSQILKQAEDGTIPMFSVPVRSLLEKIREAQRILSPHKQNILGAILVNDRIAAWEELQFYIPDLLEMGWIKQIEIDRINELLAARTYPPTYKQEWIAMQEPNAISLKNWRVAKEQKAIEDSGQLTFFEDLQLV